jgi:hypothetical protein
VPRSHEYRHQLRCEMGRRAAPEMRT